MRDMFDIYDAIKHTLDKAEELGDCKCGKEHLQLAHWLSELAFRREQEEKGE